MLRVVCGNCSSTLKAPPQLASKSVKCPKCSTLVQVPPLPQTDEPLYRLAGESAIETNTTKTAATTKAAAPLVPPVKKPKPISEAEAQAKIAQLMKGFKAELKRPRRSFGYRITELFVLFLVLLLPVLYVAMIVGVGWLFYSHVVGNFWMISSGYGFLLGMFFYGAIFIGLGALLVAMIVPAFGWGRPPEAPRRSLTPENEPALFALVDHLCDMLRAPQPVRIDVDCEVNASASFRNGVWSLFGSDLVLTIGLPLAAGLTAKELVGVLAHEFGHFTQGFSSRLTFVISRIIGWFATAATGAGGMQKRFDRDTPPGMEGCIVAFAMGIVRWCLWVGRLSLAICYYLGVFAAMSLLRRMEYDADRYEYRTVGVEAFESTFKKMRGLNEGWLAAIKTAIATAPTFTGMPEDVPAFAATVGADLLPQLENRKRYDKKKKTEVFDTHPSEKDRVAAARESGAHGVFDSDLPASALFSNFPAMCRNATFDFYRQNFAPTLAPTDMIPNDGLLDVGRRYAGYVAPAARTF